MTFNNLSKEQNIACNPYFNVWVQANAGTGKTTILIQRIIRILFFNLKNNNKTTGILCLTYTNAGSNEMNQRLINELRNLSIQSDDKLKSFLLNFIINPSAQDIKILKKMIYFYIDNPNIVKIKTIHGFCEEILKKFSFEAGIPKTWSLISDTEKNKILKETFEKMIFYSFQTKEIFDSFMDITEIISEHNLTDFYELLKNRYSIFFKIKNIHKYKEYFINKIKKILNIDINSEFISKSELIDFVKFCENNLMEKKTSKELIKKIINNTNNYIENKITFEEYKYTFLNKTNDEINKKIKEDFLIKKAYKIYNQSEYIKKNKLYKNTINIFNLSYSFYEMYKKYKLERHLLDYDDLILYTKQLFDKPDYMGFVLSEIVPNIKHIMIDEAQDTAPEQWEIIKNITYDFFSCNNEKSLFVVGDIKQSIFSFQGASPRMFIETKENINKTIINNDYKIHDLKLNINFRSQESILKLVDKIFDDDQIKEISNIENITHIPNRKDKDVFIEFCPLITNDNVI